mmetsp:Transcript_9089/g.21625  ORF Transcript_9089/g.21625 Transcript_9089/m.21625 type:complete len:279 (-) Transcript_9089:109-945(-)
MISKVLNLHCQVCLLGSVVTIDLALFTHPPYCIDAQTCFQQGRELSTFEKAVTKHCTTCHEDGILHHFAPPKSLNSVWAWEMSVRFVAQELLEDSLNRVGLQKELFLFMVRTGDGSGVKSQVTAIVGGAICNGNVDFAHKLIGCKYNGLYIPAGVPFGDMPSVSNLREMRDNARDVIIGKARKWLREELLGEMQHFDYTTMVTAFKNRKKVEEDFQREEAAIAGYIWNAFGLFFIRGVVRRSSFPPAAGSMGMVATLDSTMWDEFAKMWQRDTAGPLF